jgi:uncharacterized protein YdaT
VKAGTISWCRPDAVLLSKAPLEITMTKKQIFVERREQGDYAVRRPNSERASDILPTQKEAIHRAKELSPGTTPNVERVRHTKGGSPDKWRTS